MKHDGYTQNDKNDWNDNITVLLQYLHNSWETR